MLTKLFVKTQVALENYKQDQDGVTAIEYGLIAAGIAVVIAALVGGIGDQLEITFTSIKDTLTTFNTK